MNTPDTLTAIRARSRRLAKLIRADGTVEGYDDAKHFDLFTVSIPDLDGLHRLLRRLLDRPDCAVIRGEIANPDRVLRVRRLLYPDKKTGDVPTLRGVARQWLALDIEGVPRPEQVAATDLDGCATEAIERLPVAFRGARCIVQASGSHGIKPGVRLRLWYWLARPTTGAELKRWLHGAPADSSVFGAIQPIYTAAPVFAPGIRDHLPQRIIERSGQPLVAVPSPEELLPSSRTEATVRPVLRRGSARADLYVRAALTKAGKRIITSGQRHPAILSEACGLARLVKAGLLGRSELKSLLWQAAQQAGKDDEAEIDRILDFGLSHADTTPLPAGIANA
jgi:hypothetical protein